MIELKDLRIQYPKVLAVDNVSCIFEPGLIHGVIGPNGAGKSTLLKAMVGLIANYTGQIIYNGLSLPEQRMAIKKQLGYAPEDIDLIPYLTGREFLQMIADIRRIEPAKGRVDFLLEQLGMTGIQDKIIDGYSHGMRQKLSLAGALVGFPSILILDEALNGLDTLSLINIKKLFRELVQDGHTLVMSSHILELMEQWCDIIYIMHNGHLIEQLSREQCNTIRGQYDQGLSGYFQKIIADRI
jgi:ABC-2 type transport system ATP-binding protein